ncbi:MAG: nickel-type superoxide dismutase maturation protease [Candidatus Omnitrophica bacterium]|nr:nickel-type superoxide dismutase maturation protease [Candidatus Omnitrophota bacterium]
MNRTIRNARVKDILLWLIGRRQRIRVAGYSMTPSLHPGQEVLVNAKAYRRSKPQAGDLVTARHPYQRDVILIKRIHRVLDDERFILTGDNPDESTDSRSFGSIHKKDILGRVVCMLFP